MTPCVHLRGARTTRAAATLARAARRRPRACTCAVHAQPELRLSTPLRGDSVGAPARCAHNPSACAPRSVTTSCMHLRVACATRAAAAMARASRRRRRVCTRVLHVTTTRAAAALARVARRRPRACTCTVHAQPELRLSAPLGDDPAVRAPARCAHNPSGRCACAPRSVTTSCMHLRVACATRAAAALVRAARRQPRACTCVVHRTATALPRAARRRPRAAPAWCTNDPSGCCACVRQSATTPGMLDLRGALPNPSGRCA
eukprot:2273474-Pleurochrysis_carterae.AAC.2